MSRPVESGTIWIGRRSLQRLTQVPANAAQTLRFPLSFGRFVSSHALPLLRCRQGEFEGHRLSHVRRRSGHSAPAAWGEEARNDLAVAQKPSASELELAVIPAVRKLVLAAAQLDQLAPMGPPAWNALIETQLNPPRRRE